MSAYDCFRRRLQFAPVAPLMLHQTVAWLALSILCVPPSFVCVYIHAEITVKTSFYLLKHQPYTYNFINLFFDFELIMQSLFNYTVYP